jgi:hypothetical protein
MVEKRLPTEPCSGRTTASGCRAAAQGKYDGGLGEDPRSARVVRQAERGRQRPMSGDVPGRGDCPSQTRLCCRQRLSGPLDGKRRHTGRREWGSFVYGHATQARLVVGMACVQALKCGACVSKSWRRIRGLHRIAQRAGQQESEREERKRSKTAPPVARAGHLRMPKRAHHVAPIIVDAGSTKLIQVKPTAPAAGRTTPRGASPREMTS